MDEAYIQDCPSCQQGIHEQHDAGWGTKPGLIGGSVCECAGDCARRLQETLDGIRAQLHAARDYPSSDESLTAADLPFADRIVFDGSGESCEKVTMFLGGYHASDTHGWNATTNSGGYVVNHVGMPETFRPGDTIVRDPRGGFLVERLGGND